MSDLDAAGAKRSHFTREGAISRRDFFAAATGPIAALTLSRTVGARGVRDGAGSLAGPGVFLGAGSGAYRPETGMGIAVTSLSAPGRTTTASVPGRDASRPATWDAYELLEKCRELGGAGIQTELNGDLKKLRSRAEQFGMWIEGMVSVPRNGDPSSFVRSLSDAKTCGVTVMRTALLGGRRYESFNKLEDWTRWVDQSRKALEAVVPLLDRHRVTLAIENHKDWTLDEMRRLLKTYDSQYVGCCFDFGNNIALLDDPMEMAVSLAPYVRATHVKDMAVRPYQDGFLLSEVPLGAGVLDLAGMISVLKRPNPDLRLSLEMITRDPLKVPCLTPRYWEVFPDRGGQYLARTLTLVQQHSSDGPLPTVSQLPAGERVHVEEENIKTCMSYARARLAL